MTDFWSEHFWSGLSSMIPGAKPVVVAGDVVYYDGRRKRLTKKRRGNALAGLAMDDGSVVGVHVGASSLPQPTSVQKSNAFVFNVTGGDDGSLPLGRWARNALAAIGVAVLAAVAWKVARR